MIGIGDLPHLNAAMNAAATVCIVTGLVAIRRRRERLHKRCMLAALACSTVFLVSYVTYHYAVGHVGTTLEGAARTAYLAMLFSHVVLAVVLVPLVIVTVVAALRDDRPRHRRWARRTAPVWLYVSVTGVVVYVVNYGLPWS